MNNKSEHMEKDEEGRLPACLVCGIAFAVRPARGRISGKPFIMIICPADGRHFRGFITYQPYVMGVVESAGERGSPGRGGSQ